MPLHQRALPESIALVSLSPSDNKDQKEQDIVELVSPAVAADMTNSTVSRCDQARNVLSSNPIGVSVASSALAQILFAVSWLGSEVTTGEIVRGALSTYDEGNLQGQLRYKNVTSGEYNISVITDSKLLHPNLIESAEIKKHLEIKMYATFCLSLFMDIAMLASYSRRNHKYRSILLSFTAFATFLISYAVLGGFTWVGKEADGYFHYGQELGNSTYGFADGQNKYCSHLNYKGVCPSPTKYEDLLMEMVPKVTFTQQKDNTDFFAVILLSLALAPTISAAIFAAKKLHQHFMFRRGGKGEKQMLLSRVSQSDSDSMPEPAVSNSP